MPTRCAVSAGPGRRGKPSSRRAIGSKRVSQREWYLATVDLVEALLLDDFGRTAEALQRVRRAAPRFEEKGTRDRYVQAVMMEASIVWSAGDRAAAAGVWRAVAERAHLRQDAALAATLEARIGLFELAHGDPGHAETMLVSALSQLDRLGVAREAARTRWHMAEAAAAAGRPHPAVSQLYKAHAGLIGVRDVRDAAIVSARILELLLLTGRDAEAAVAARTFADTFREAECRRAASPRSPGSSAAPPRPRSRPTTLATSAATSRRHPRNCACSRIPGRAWRRWDDACTSA